MSITNALMAYLQRLPKKTDATAPATKDAEKNQSSAERLESLTAWLANREKPAPEVSPTEQQSSDDVELSVFKFLTEQEARKGKRKAQQCTASTG